MESPVLRMQEAGAGYTLPLHCTFYLPCDSIIILNLPKFNYILQGEPAPTFRTQAGRGGFSVGLWPGAS